MWSGATAVLAGSTIADCASQGGGGGICACIPTRGSNPGPADSCSSAIIYSCHLDTFIGTDGHANVTLRGGSRVERCRATYGGAVGVFEGSAAKILDGSVLSECHGTSWAGGAFIWCMNVPCHAEFVQSSILNCSALNAGGFYSGGASLLAANSVRCATARTHRKVPIWPASTQGLRFRPAPRGSADC